MKIFFAAPSAKITSGTIALAVRQGGKLSAAAEKFDKTYKGAIRRAVSDNGFDGKQGALLSLTPLGGPADKVLLYGCGKGGKGADMDDDSFRLLGAQLYKAAAKSSGALHVFTDEATTAEQACLMAYGAEFCAYKFTKYLTVKKTAAKSGVKELRLYGSYSTAAAQKAYKDYAALLQGSGFTRDLVSEPPNELYPQSFASRCKSLSRDGVKVTVLGEAQLQKLGMRALLGVGQGSARQSQVVIMEWHGAKNKSAAPLAFIGKGVTFDTGGISLKPGPGMEEMKWDMAGAATVSGLLKTLALRKAPVNAVGIIGLVENMPDGNAQRPGDIVKSYDGKTIEIHNTDAEGRLVLADLLGYCEKRFKPRSMIDLATLTGAIVISLGHEYAGLFSRDDKLAEQLFAAGSKSGEKLWRMPLHKAYDKLLDTSHADMKNIGGRGAGSITAAQFLGRFVDKCPWAHLDIAGVAWWNKGNPMGSVGASGFGVALLDTWVKSLS